MPDGDIRSAIHATQRRVPAGLGRLAVLAGAVLAVFLLPLDIPDTGGWLGVKPAAASHDKSGDKGKGHNGQGGGGAGGSGDDDEPGGGTSGISDEPGQGGGAMEAAEAEDAALRETLSGLEPADPSAADGTTDGLPTIRQIFTLPEDAVVGPDEERALIAGGWNAR